MTRQKKSRKAPSLGPTQKPRQKKADKSDTTGKRGKKTRGLAAGSRNNPETQNTSAKKQPGKSNDPRHGSKTPISLTPVEPVFIPDTKPMAKVTKVKEPDLAPEQELEQIENDERLMALLERVDNDELLTGKDAKYFNAKMARHKVLMDELGYEDDDDFDDDEDDFDDESGNEKSLVEQWEDDDWDHQDEGKDDQDQKGS